MGHIIIVGAGEVGYNTAERLSHEQWDVTVIDQNARLLERVVNTLDVQVVEGNGSSPQVLKEAGISRSELLVAATDSDETNIVACMVANAYAPQTCQKIARIRNPDYTDDKALLGRGQWGIDFHINPESVAAKKILKLLNTPQATDIFTFAEGRVLVVGLGMPKNSPLLGKSLAEIGSMYSEKHFLAVAIERNDSVIIPRGDNRLHEGDTLFVVTPPKNLQSLIESMGIPYKPVRHVAIYGGSRIGHFLASRLEKEGISVRIIESDRDKCQAMAESLHRSVVLHGYATDRTLLREENIHKMDAFIAVTEDEESNILSSLLAKRMGTPKVISLVNQLSYGPLIRNVGVDAAISPRHLATSMILHFIRRGKVLQVDALGEEQAEAIEFVADEKSSIVGIPLAEANLPKDAVVGAIVRDDQVSVASGNTVIQPDDRVIVFALQHAVAELERRFSS
ncbi:MAG: Trk system potassium transporter TrkA [Deltaproteobacteria bacterium]|nr:Trk system potassium transporter TrkA [Deltaproteobacteria bacterium]MBU52690.1 Trk system potassium transporter TrkA [Deltaproteobacteria bacterium]|tara:strand:+ start:332 stop:1687 length:1356 start_codon:yes stop_codon:yes gene_type:complete